MRAAGVKKIDRIVGLPGAFKRAENVSNPLNRSATMANPDTTPHPTDTEASNDHPRAHAVPLHTQQLRAVVKQHLVSVSTASMTSEVSRDPEPATTSSTTLVSPPAGLAELQEARRNLEILFAAESQPQKDQKALKDKLRAVQAEDLHLKKMYGLFENKIDNLRECHQEQRDLVNLSREEAESEMLKELNKSLQAHLKTCGEFSEYMDEQVKLEKKRQAETLEKKLKKLKYYKSRVAYLEKEMVQNKLNLLRMSKDKEALTELSKRTVWMELCYHVLFALFAFGIFRCAGELDGAIVQWVSRGSKQ